MVSASFSSTALLEFSAVVALGSVLVFVWPLSKCITTFLGVKNNLRPRLGAPSSAHLQKYSAI